MRLPPFLGLLPLAASVSCGSSTTATDAGARAADPAPIVHVTFDVGASVSLAVLNTVRINATATAFGGVIGTNSATPAVNWDSSDPSTALIIDDSGGAEGASSIQLLAVVKCFKPGTAIISLRVYAYVLSKETGLATLGNDLASTTITCTSQTPTSVTFDTSDHNRSGNVGTTKQLSPKAADAAGNTVSNASFTWSTANASVATVSSSGLVSYVSPGTASITATSTANSTLSASIALTAVGTGSCSLNPAGINTKALKFAVQSDPGNHAAQIGFSSTNLQIIVFSFQAQSTTPITASGPAPFTNVAGGWMGADCAFVMNGQGDVGGFKNVGVRLQGTWTNGTLSLTYTVGTNGELSGGAVVYTVTG